MRFREIVEIDSLEMWVNFRKLKIIVRDSF